MKKTIALIGNPNCGKTSIFNILTNSDSEVGNWAGVTVEKTERELKYNRDIKIIDLPGVYSLASIDNEELITREFLLSAAPDAIINVLDATNITKNLYLSTQILELKLPTILVLNMMDLVEKSGKEIDVDLLSEKLGCRVIKFSAVKETGIRDFVFAILEILKNNRGQKVSKESFRSDLFLNDDDEESIEKRYRYIDNILNTVQNDTSDLNERIDNIALDKKLALPILFLVLFLLYYVSVSLVGKFGSFVIEEKFFRGFVTKITKQFLFRANVSGWIQNLVEDGILRGTSVIIGFVPQLFSLFFFLHFLEESGYMARVVFITDKLLSKFGFSGKSFIPFVLSSGCGVTGIMSTRTIENEHERKTTMVLTTFIPCSAKIPMITLVASTIFEGNLLIAPSIYLISVFSIAVSGLILKNTKMFRTDTPFIIEVPKYDIPKFSKVFRYAWNRTKTFVVKSGGSVFLVSMFVWFLSNFNFVFSHNELSIANVENDRSMLAVVGNMIAPIFRPLGFDDWRATVATLSGLAAKENIVSSLSVLLGNSNVELSGNSLNQAMKNNFDAKSIYPFVVFNTLCVPCIAAVQALVREMNDKKWVIFAVLYQTIFAYIVAYIIRVLMTIFPRFHF